MNATASRRLDRSELRFNQMSIIALLVVGFLLDSVWLVALVGLVMAVGTLWPRLGLFKRFYHTVVKPAGWLKPDLVTDTPDAHLFAQGVGALFLVAATLALHFVGYLVVLAALRATGEPIHLEGLLVAVPLWAVMAIAVAGIALALASLQVFVRDVEHVLMPVLMMLMYLTPILYPLSLVPERLRGWVSANPFTWLVGRLRAALLEGRLAPEAGDLAALAVALALFAAGRWMFRRLSPYFEDFV